VGPPELNQLLQETRINTHVLIENLALVALDLRLCSQTTVPAELPSGSLIGASIDLMLKPRLTHLGSLKDQGLRMREIHEIRQVMASAFKELVTGSAEYRSLLSWARRLGLRVDEAVIRPTVHEVYLCKESGVQRELRVLMKERDRLRSEVIRKANSMMGQAQFAYPEEFDGAWVRRMGRLLGYPSCCVDRYASDRVSGVNVEQRAAAQIGELESAPDPHVYFNSYFFPCSPSCEKAKERGELIHQKISEALPAAGQVYETVMAENLERVRRQPEIIGEYLSRARGV